MLTLEKTITELYRFFKLLNKHFYNGEIEQPVIIVQSKGKNKNALGWCTTQKIWSDKGEEQQHFYEISISAEFLHLPTVEIIDTLLHEMVHLYNLQRNVKDCSRGNTYHNTVYRDTAREHGLDVIHNPKHGWNGTSLNEATQNLITSISVDEDAFRLVRANTEIQNGTNGGKKGNSIKYACPMCGTSVRATKKVNVICADCDAEMTVNGELPELDFCDDNIAEMTVNETVIELEC